MPRIPGLRRFFRLGDARTSTDVGAVDDELRFHIETRADELIASGVSRTDADAIALREFGDVARYRDHVLTIDHHYAREMQMRDFLESVGGDVRYAWRSLRSQPGFTAVAIVTLALGIGATTAVFSTVSGVLLRPLPYATADRIVHLGERSTDRPGRGGTTSYDNFVDWQRMSRSFAAMGLFNTWQPTLTGRGDPERVSVAGVTAGLFDVFGIMPALGRAIVPTDNLANAAPVAVVSYDFWRTRLNADRSVIGQTVLLNFQPIQVVGVLPSGFVAPGNLNRPIWVNFGDDTDGRGGRSKNVYALLAPNVTADRAQLEMSRIARELAQQYPDPNKDHTVMVERLGDRIVGDMRRPLYLLLGASLFVLLIACANLSNLLLARGVTRARELAVRVALGGERRRIVRQLLTESALLAALGSIAGVAIAAVATKSIRSLGPALFQSRAPELDIRVLSVAIGLSVLTTLLFGLMPALRAAPHDPQRALRATSSRASGGQTARTRTALAVVQLGLAVVLLSACALVIKSFVRILRVEAGINGDHVLTMSVSLPRARYDSAKSTIFYQQLQDRFAANPDVRGVAFTSLVPFSGDFDRVSINKFDGEPDRAGGDAPEGDRYIVTPSYFATMGVRLVRGRLLSADDRFEAQPVCVVDEVFAKRVWGDQNPIGRRMKLPMRPEMATVVGVVTHVKTYGLDVTSPGQIYMSNAQFQWRWMSMVVRTSGDPALFAPAAARTIHELDRDQPISDVATMDDMMDNLLRARRFTLTLLGAFANVAIVLAAIGLYGVIAYGVSQRRREFGVRIALGARASQIGRMVLLEGARMALAGLVVGGIAAFALSRVVSTLLFEVDARDVSVFALVSFGLIAVALIACVIPARRATRVDASEVLRGE
jgi:putative ABC transport system permease protein